MEVYAYGRHEGDDPHAKILIGKDGLEEILRKSDVIVVALPLTKLTHGLINKANLSLMKDNCVLVNIARGEIVNEGEIYEHLSNNPDFVYATDVWWSKNGEEVFSSDFPLLKLSNFIGTPHISGPSELVTGMPVKKAIENLGRFLKGEKPRNIVNTSDYV